MDLQQLSISSSLSLPRSHQFNKSSFFLARRNEGSKHMVWAHFLQEIDFFSSADVQDGHKIQSLARGSERIGRVSRSQPLDRTQLDDRFGLGVSFTNASMGDHKCPIISRVWVKRFHVDFDRDLCRRDKTLRDLFDPLHLLGPCI